MRLLIRNLVPLAWLFAICCKNPTAASPDAHLTLPGADSTEKIKEPVQDTAYNRFLFDTVRVFSNSGEIVQYWRQLQDSLYSFRKKALDTSQFKEAQAMTLDSLNLVNSGRLAYAGLKFLKAKPDKTEKDLFLLVAASNFEANSITYEEVKAVFESFPQSARRLPAALKISKKLKEYETAIFPVERITLLKIKDSLQREFTMGDLLKGSYGYHILVFGASWCRPCRIENHYLKGKVKDPSLAKVNFIGISIDTDRGRWINAIRQDACSWPQYNDPLAFDSPLAKAISLTGVPDNILIDRSGKVVLRSRNVEFLLDKIRQTQK